MTDVRTCGRGAVIEPVADVEKIEALWGPPPWELDLSNFYPPEVMERVIAITMDGIRFERKGAL
ncbi:MAG: hypothetical protein IJ111_05840 [Eggerthellaceae bacterium]|nr:hypothetical protein [Eggerthellaceae bacterium]